MRGRELSERERERERVMDALERVMDIVTSIVDHLEHSHSVVPQCGSL